MLVYTYAVKDLFNRMASALTQRVGSPFALAVAAGVILVWAVSGPIFGFSDTWQLVINTGTTIVTFLMVFVIQNAQNRDSKAVHAKLDEILRVLPDARVEFVDAEHEPEDLLDRQIEELRALAQAHPGLRETLAERIEGLSDLEDPDDTQRTGDDGGEAQAS